MRGSCPKLLGDMYDTNLIDRMLFPLSLLNSWEEDVSIWIPTLRYQWNLINSTIPFRRYVWYDIYDSRRATFTSFLFHSFFARLRLWLLKRSTKGQIEKSLELVYQLSFCCSVCLLIGRGEGPWKDFLIGTMCRDGAVKLHWGYNTMLRCPKDPHYIASEVSRGSTIPCFWGVHRGSTIHNTMLRCAKDPQYHAELNPKVPKRHSTILHNSYITTLRCPPKELQYHDAVVIQKNYNTTLRFAQAATIPCWVELSKNERGNNPKVTSNHSAQ